MKSSKKLFTPHDSQRGYFAYALWEMMHKDPKIRIVTADLGFGVFDKLRDRFPARFFNPGAAEQTSLGICIGMALSGLKPVFYSITPFALWRPAELIRNYLHHENIKVVLACSGKNDDYTKHDGFSHDATDATKLLSLFPNIMVYLPNSNQEAYNSTVGAIKGSSPSAIILSR